MFLVFVLFSICFCCLLGVDPDEVKSVSVMEGESVTLYKNLTDIQKYKLVLWKFRRSKEEAVIVRINKEASKTTINDTVYDGMFRDRLQVDDQTGSLNITNITTQHSGLYQMTIISDQMTSYRFSVTVHGLTFRHTSQVVMCCAAVGCVMIVSALLIICICKKHKNTQQQEAVQSGEKEITYTDLTFRRTQTHKANAAVVEEEVLYASVNKRR